MLNILLYNFRLRKYELEVDQSCKRGPEVERIYFVILEMARKYNNTYIKKKTYINISQSIHNFFSCYLCGFKCNSSTKRVVSGIQFKRYSGKQVYIYIFFIYIMRINFFGV